MCAFRQHKQTHTHIYLKSEDLRTHHGEEHVLPEEVLRHELSEVPEVGWKNINAQKTMCSILKYMILI